MSERQPVHLKRTQVIQENRRRAKILNATDDHASQVLAAKLERNADRLERHRHHECHCNCAACAQCTVRDRREFIAASLTFLRHQNCALWSVTIVPARSAVLAEHMPAWNAVNFVRAIKAKLSTIEHSVLHWAFGRVDISFNTDRRTNSYPPHFQPHVHLVAGSDDPDTLKQALKMLFRNSQTPLIYKATHCVPFKADAYSISYLVKDRYYARNTFWEEDGKPDSRSHLALPSRATKALLLGLGRHSLSDQMLFLRCRRRGGEIYQYTNGARDDVI